MRVLQCPQCGWRGEVYDTQIRGDISLVCSNCGWHGYSNRTKHNVGGLPVVDVDRFVLGHRRFSPTIRNYRRLYEE